MTEVVLLVLPVQLVWGLQMARSKKAMIIAAFYLRIAYVRCRRVKRPLMLISSSVIGFSIGRNYYTLQLRLPSADAGLDSGLVVIMLQIELTWALAASTLSALKAFTESFNSGFGLGFTRGKGDDSYGMSDMSGKTPDSSKKEKSLEDSTNKSNASGTEIGSHLRSAPDFDELADQLGSVESSTKFTSGDTPVLKLRPEAGIKTVTSVSTESECEQHRDSMANRSENSSSGDMVILRE